MLLIFYIAVLSWLHSRGYLAPQTPPDLSFIGLYPDIDAAGIAASGVTLNARGERFLLEGTRVEHIPIRQNIMVYLPKNGAVNHSIRPGQRLRLRGRLRRPRPARAPGDFDEQRLMFDHGILWIMKASRVAIAAPSPWHWAPRVWAESAHRSLENAFARLMPGDAARLMDGITMGYKGPLSREMNRAVQDSGAMHVLVPSGAKVACVLAAVFAACSLLGLPSSWRAGLAAAVGGFYVLLVGAAPPYTRAYIQALALILGRLSGREGGVFQAMVLAALLTLILDPRALFDAGFQMTYLASFGMILAMPTLHAALRPKPAWLRYALSACAMSAIVTAMLWPTFANIFGRGSLAGVAANLALVPFAEALMAGGYLLWAWDSAFGNAGVAAAAKALEWAALSWARLCAWFASLPGAACPLSSMSPREIAAYYGAVLAVLVWPRRKASAALAAAAAFLTAVPAVFARLAPPRLNVTLLPSIEGQTAVVRRPDGAVWLIRFGKPPPNLRQSLRELRVTSFDRLVLAGAKPRRWEAARRLLREFPTARVDAAEAPFRFCQGQVCFEIGAEDGPRVLRGEAEYSIIPLRLRKNAVAVSTDGFSAQVF